MAEMLRNQPIQGRLEGTPKVKPKEELGTFEKIGVAFDTLTTTAQAFVLGEGRADARASGATLKAVDSNKVWKAIKDLPQEQQEYVLGRSITNEVDLYGAINYAKQKSYTDRLWRDGLNTAEKIGYGGVAILTDPVEAPLYLVPFVGAATKAGFAANAVIGAATAITSTALSNVAQGNEVTQHLGLAAAFGGTLQGGASYLLRDTGKAIEKDMFVTPDGKQGTLDIKAAKELEIAQTQKEIDSLNETIKLHTGIKASIGKHEETLKEIASGAKVADKNVINEIKTTITAKIDEAKLTVVEMKNKLKEVTKETKVIIKDQQALIKQKEAHQKTLEKEITLLQKEVDEFDKVSVEAYTHKQNIDALSKEMDDIFKNEITVYQKQLEDMKLIPNPTEAQKALMTKVEEMLVKSKEELGAIKQLRTNAKRTATIVSKKAKAELEAKLTAKLKEVEEASASSLRQIGDNGKVITTGKAEAKELENTIKDYEDLIDEMTKHKKFLPKDINVMSDYAKKMTQKLVDAKAMLEPNKFRGLLEERGLLFDDLAKMSDDKFTVNDFKHMKAYKETYMAKLDRELREIAGQVNTIEGLRNSAPIKNSPSWLNKLLISPIAKLSTSENQYVRGLANKLHESTIYTGLVEQHNASIVRKEIDRELKNTLMGCREDWIKYKATVDVNITMEKYLEQVHQQAIEIVSKMKIDATKGINAGMEHKAFKAKIAENLGKAKRSFVATVEVNTKSSVNRILDYFEAIHKRGADSGIEGFITSAGKGYLPRIYSFQKIEELGRDTAIQLLYDAQVKYRQMTNGVLDDIARADFLKKAEAAIDGTIRREEMLKETVDKIESGTSRLGERSIEVLDGDIAPLLNNDLFEVLGHYKLGVHGKIALQETVGVSSLTEFENVILNKIPNLSAGDKDKLKIVVQTILGTRELTKNPFDGLNRTIKGMSSVSSIMSIAGFIAPTITEASAIVMNYGFKGLTKNFFGDVKQVYKAYKTGNIDTQNEIWLMSDFGEALLGSNMARFEAEGGIDAVGKVQNVLDSLTVKGALYGGLQPLTDFLRLKAATANVNYLAKLSVKNKLSRTDLQQLDDMGITVETLAKIKDKLAVSPEGLITNRNRATWGGLDDTISRAGLLMLDRTILHPSGATLPKFMTNYELGGIIPRIFAKFLRFPVESYERLLVRGIQEADINKLSAVALNTALWSFILLAKDSLVPEEQQKYSQGTDEQMMDLMRMSLYSGSFTAFPTTVADKLVGVGTGEGLMGYSQSVSPVTTTVSGMIQYGKFNASVPFGKAGINLSEGTARLYNQQWELWEATKDYEVSYKQKTLWEGGEEE